MIRQPQQYNSTWPVADLARRLSAALKIAQGALRTLGEAGYFHEAAGIAASADKVIAETAILLVASSPACRIDPELTRLHRRLASQLVPYARSKRIWTLACLQPRAAAELGFAHSCLTALGFPDRQIDSLFDDTLMTAAQMGRERLPHRELEQEWIRAISTAAPTKTHAALQRSLVAQGMDVLSIDRDDIYALTHGLMYATKFGQSRPRLPRAWRLIENDAEAAVAYALDHEDYDLLGETLLTWPLLRRRWSPTATFAFHVLAWVQDEAGFLPAPGLDVGVLRRLPANERSEHTFAAAYHTVYVGGLLAAAALKSQAPPKVLRSGRGGRRHEEELMRLVLESNTAAPRHWIERLASLTGGQREALGSLFLDVYLQRKFAARDLQAIRLALELPASRPLFARRSVHQAASLLARASRLNSVMFQG